MNDLDYWITRKQEEVRKLEKACGKAKAKRLMAELSAEATSFGWTPVMFVNAIIDARNKAFAEVLNEPTE